ncbi:MAG: AAA family ATPase [Actinobacteria bacterium]|nr:AAA family ATPase [Actinomycetota bacterium]MCL5444793.1 AAA family ATPase [Actinomycetota bacterium]
MSHEKPLRIVLVGMMGSGKTTVASSLAERFSVAHIDTDTEVELALGCSCAEAFSRFGELKFRETESRILKRVLDETQGSSCVVSLGGGAVLSEENRDLIQGAGTVVWLRARIETLEERVGAGTGRPLLAGGVRSALEGILIERGPTYEELATVVVDVDDQDVSDVVETIADRLGERCEK